VSGEEKTATPEEDDLAILFPDVDVDVRDPDTGGTVRLAVREFRMLEGMRAQAVSRGLVAALAALARESEDVADLSVESLDAVLGEHVDVWVDLIARATDRDAGWLARLSDADGRALNAAMWEANGPFFTRRVVASLVGLATTARTLASLGSWLTSSPRATEPGNGTSPSGSPAGRSDSPGATPASGGPTSPATSH